MKKKALLILAVILACSMRVYGEYQESVTVTNHISTGNVDIRLSEYQQDGKSVREYRDPGVVLPGEEISKIVRVENLGEPAYVRIKVSWANDREGIESLQDKDLLGIGKDWKKAGEYYYYKKPLKKRESVDFMKGLRIPAEWDSSHSLQNISLAFRADAIQARNMSPDFSAMSPWGNQTILASIKESPGESEKLPAKDSLLTVVFQGEAHKLLALPEDFFKNFGTIMPGDTFSDQVYLVNKTKESTEILFAIQLDSPSPEELALLNALELRISYNGNPIYKGNLTAEKLKSGISLGNYGPGEAGYLDFSVHMPTKLDNAYAVLTASEKWIFTVKGKETQPVKPEEARINPNPSTPLTESYKGYEPVKTGDDTPVLLFARCAFFGIVTGLFVFMLKKRRRL